MKCDHKHFVKVSELSKGRPGHTNTMQGIPGAEIVCAECGEVRHVWANGLVEVKIPGHELPA